MSLNNIRPAFYSEDALNANDYKNISTVFAHNALVNEVTSNKWAINTPYTIMLNIGRENLQYKLDNKPWYASNSNMVIIPKGNHTLEFDTLSQSLNTISLKSITGELMWAKFSNQKLNFEYNEELTSCYVILDKKPARVYVDNKITDCLYVNNNEFILKLPKGKHKVQIDC
jgi:DNA-binding beta-propeller fold protein YncE